MIYRITFMVGFIFGYYLRNEAVITSQTYKCLNIIQKINIKNIYFLFSQCIYEIKYNGINLYIRLRLFSHFRAYSNNEQLMNRKC